MSSLTLTSTLPITTMAELTALLASASVAELQALAAVLPSSSAAPTKSSAAKKPRAPKAIELPAAEDGAIDASAYRISPSEIDHTVCIARAINPSSADKRWKPAVYRELQCGKAVVEGGLCKTCASRLEKYEANPTPKSAWHGTLTEEPLPWMHMLGTEWAAKSEPKWLGEDAVDRVSDASSESGSDVQESVMSKAVSKAATKAAKDAEKAAAKEAKEAEKKAKKEAEKEAKKATAAKKPTVAATAETVAAKASTTAPVTEAAGSIEFIDGDMYMVKGSKVYSYDEITEKAGDYVGAKTADGIDRSVAE